MDPHTSRTEISDFRFPGALFALHAELDGEVTDGPPITAMFRGQVFVAGHRRLGFPRFAKRRNLAKQ